MDRDVCTARRWCFAGWMLACCAGIFGCDPAGGKPSPAPSSANAKTTGAAQASAGKPNSLRAQKLLDANKLDEAWDECQKVLVGNPDDARGLWVAASVMQRRKKTDTALKLIDRIDLKNPEYGLKSAILGARWSWEQMDLLDTERRCQNILASHPEDVETITLLAACLDFQGRRFEASKLNQDLVRLGKFSIMTLILAIDSMKPLESDAAIEKLVSERPKEPLLRSAIAFGELHEHRVEQAEKIFREIAAVPNAPTGVLVGLGIALVDQEKYEEIPGWLGLLSKTQAETFPSYWRVLGQWYQHQERFEDAIYCYTKSAELDPFDYLALTPLSQCLAIQGRTEEATAAESLFQRHQLANRNVNYTRDGFRKPEWMLQIADELEKSGRIVEAFAWRETCEQTNDKNQSKIEELQKQRRAHSERSSLSTSQSAGRTGFTWNTNAMPRPDLEAISKQASHLAEKTAHPKPHASVVATVRLEDRAQALGIQQHYWNGDDPKVPGMQTYQSNGGGAAAIDFDQDGWIDFFLLQAGGDPREPQTNRACSLYRSLSGQSFANVAPKAHVENFAYGQGAAVGDWDQDGFPDLLILNFGENRLLRNMGDGTFAQVDVPSMKRDIKQAPVWSVSGAIADIDGDQLPDIVEINYSSGIDVISHFCYGPDREVQVCRPTEFPASPDYIYLSDGQGGFVVANGVWDMPLDDGRGLGIIVANLDGMNGNDIYIANDMSANNLLISYPDTKDSHRFVVRDEAVRRGCATDYQGKPQASMGVGCADVDRNGQLDLFMTNFLNEYNALYLQSTNHSFQDASRRYGFTDNDKATLGFGTQLVDLDLDGWHDAVIVNGHVEDYSKTGKPFKMKPQLLLQRDNKFIEVTNSVGTYFGKSCLARCLGIADFDRDGRPDFYVTHLDSPFALLRNETESNGNWLMIDLIGVQSERDAIGAQLRVQAGDEVWVHQKIGGSGFECTNEPFVHFGLGIVHDPLQLEVTWPSGKKQSWSNLSPNHRLVIIEGMEEVTVRY